MDIFGIKKRRRRKEVADALDYNMVMFAWLSEKLTQAELRGDNQEAERLRKGYCRTLEVIEKQRKFLYG